MASFKNGILGGFSGKVGPVVGYQVGDKSYMRSKPRAPKKFTAKELANQQKFRMVQKFISPFSDLLKVGFHNYYTPTGGIRAAVSYTRKEALKVNGDDFYIDPALVKISGGDLLPASNVYVQFNERQEITISWDTIDVNGYNEADQLMVLIYNAKDTVAITRIFNGAFRKDGSITVEWTKKKEDIAVDIYIGFVAADRSAQSDSQYLGRFTF